jgi:hypothetical protein
MNSDCSLQLDSSTIKEVTHVFLDNLLDLLLLEILLQVVLDEQLHGGTPTETGTIGILGDGESAASSRLPDVLLVVVVLGSDLHLLGDKV